MNANSVAPSSAVELAHSSRLEPTNEETSPPLVLTCSTPSTEAVATSRPIPAFTHCPSGSFFNTISKQFTPCPSHTSNCLQRKCDEWQQRIWWYQQRRSWFWSHQCCIHIYRSGRGGWRAWRRIDPAKRYWCWPQYGTDTRSIDQGKYHMMFLSFPFI